MELKAVKDVLFLKSRDMHGGLNRLYVSTSDGMYLYDLVQRSIEGTYI